MGKPLKFIPSSLPPSHSQGLVLHKLFITKPHPQPVGFQDSVSQLVQAALCLSILLPVPPIAEGSRREQQYTLHPLAFLAWSSTLTGRLGQFLAAPMQHLVCRVPSVTWVSVLAGWPSQVCLRLSPTAALNLSHKSCNSPASCCIWEVISLHLLLRSKTQDPACLL